ncbi:Thg1-domain-containing protein [Plenodomus tracheiphilus IPT5]|uniref:tRNA(His) guanylyltransferase n=1 Tax=Plenodomus tracheiphilus IPT5 TaxID=1408161 RepID=A0A6A7BGB0_9PLEO|nr:Thg1-domain-containing protein [Plenodomus tracheiphilus IPT5]
MANSRYEYVRSFEQPDTLLANTWIVVRIDGRGFSKFTTKYKFVKPNDRDALDLMNAAAQAVMKELTDLVLAYGNSDEYSFVFHKDCSLFERRASKLTTTIVSTFTSYYVFLWSRYFPEKALTPPLPSFDGRAVCYPSDFNLRDYMSWRQVDCHINNLYNTTFWTLVQKGGMDPRAAEQRLSGTVSSDKNELLFKDFGINYNKEPECFKKGTVLYRDFFPTAPIELSSPTLGYFPPPPLAHPQPRRVSPHPIARPVEKAIPLLQDGGLGPESPGQGPGPTFLSTTSTPSPPSSPRTMSRSGFPNPLRSNPVSPRNSTYPPTSMLPISPPSTITSPYGSMTLPQSKQPFPSLVPLPLSPLTLKPSTKPPTSLDPPNPTTRTNFSPTSPPRDFPSAFQISGYSHTFPTAANHIASHSASASMSTSTPSSGPPLTHQNRLKHRSPSQPHLPSYLAQHKHSASGPPSIPLRMSSIPANSKPRKLSLQNSRSNSTLKAVQPSNNEKEMCLSPAQTAGSMTPRKVSPPLRTNKELPSPPLSREEELRTREKVKSNGGSPHSESSSRGNDGYSHRRRTSESDNRGGQVWSDEDITHPGIAELPATTSTASYRRGNNHSRLDSTSTSASLSYPHQSPDVEALSSSIASTSKSNGSPSLQPIASTNGSLDMDDLLSTPPKPPVRSSSYAKAKAKASQTSSPSAAKAAKSKEKDKENKYTPFTTTTSTSKKPQKSHSDPTSRSKAPAKPNTKAKTVGAVMEQGGVVSATHAHAHDNHPTTMSRTQRDKDRKKRSQARIVMEHVDIIKDEFWEKRPWILSGKTG